MDFTFSKLFPKYNYGLKFVNKQNIGFGYQLINLNLAHLKGFSKPNTFFLRYIMLSFKILSGK
ncbi:hypothetical protein ASF92_10400 [Pedobacter sp. Leaf176]|nr:hypothetical protein ASF92_10400 [Pedobacter sp. Leaf176]